MVDGSEIGRRISVLRQKRGITLPELASQAKVSKGYLWGLETHRERRPTDPAPNPGLDVLARLAKALDTTVADLVTEQFNVETLSSDNRLSLPPALAEFLEESARIGNPVPDDVVPMLAGIKLRGRRPQSVEDWAAIYAAIEERIPSPEE